jgi:hypothetical protein
MPIKKIAAPSMIRRISSPVFPGGPGHIRTKSRHPAFAWNPNKCTEKNLRPGKTSVSLKKRVESGAFTVSAEPCKWTTRVPIVALLRGTTMTGPRVVDLTIALQIVGGVTRRDKSPGELHVGLPAFVSCAGFLQYWFAVARALQKLARTPLV